MTISREDRMYRAYRRYEDEVRRVAAEVRRSTLIPFCDRYRIRLVKNEDIGELSDEYGNEVYAAHDGDMAIKEMDGNLVVDVRFIPGSYRFFQRVYAGVPPNFNHRLIDWMKAYTPPNWAGQPSPYLSEDEYKAVPLKGRLKRLHEMLERGRDIPLRSLQTPEEWRMRLSRMSVWRLKRIACRLTGDQAAIRAFEHTAELVEYMINAKFPEEQHDKTA